MPARAVDVHEAQRQLASLIEQVEAGEEIEIDRDGLSVALLVPIERRRRPRRLGVWKDQVWIAPDFDAPIPELER